MGILSAVACLFLTYRYRSRFLLLACSATFGFWSIRKIYKQYKGREKKSASKNVEKKDITETIETSFDQRSVEGCSFTEEDFVEKWVRAVAPGPFSYCTSSCIGSVLGSLSDLEESDNFTSISDRINFRGAVKSMSLNPDAPNFEPLLLAVPDVPQGDPVLRISNLQQVKHNVTDCYGERVFGYFGCSYTAIRGGKSLLIRRIDSDIELKTIKKVFNDLLPNSGILSIVEFLDVDIFHYVLYDGSITTLSSFLKGSGKTMQNFKSIVEQLLTVYQYFHNHGYGEYI